MTSSPLSLPHHSLSERRLPVLERALPRKRTHHASPNAPSDTPLKQKRPRQDKAELEKENSTSKAEIVDNEFLPENLKCFWPFAPIRETEFEKLSGADIAAISNIHLTYVGSLPTTLALAYRIEVDPEKKVVRTIVSQKDVFTQLLGHCHNEEQRRCLIDAVNKYCTEKVKANKTGGIMDRDPIHTRLPEVCTNRKHQGENPCRFGQHLYRSFCLTCDGVFCDDHTLPGFTVRVREDEYQLYLQPPKRNVVLMSREGREESLHSNEDLVKSEEFWDSALKVHEFLKEKVLVPQPVEYMAFNFGYWEKKIRFDPTISRCHGHLHICISRLAALALGSKISKFKGYLDTPNDYNYEDLAELLTLANGLSHLDSRGLIAVLKAGQENLKAGQENLEGKVDDLKAGQENLEGKVDNLEGKVDDLKAGQENLKKFVEGCFTHLAKALKVDLSLVSSDDKIVKDENPSILQ